MRRALLLLLALAPLPALGAAPECPTTLSQDALNQCWVDAAEATNQRLGQLLRELKRSLNSKNWARLKESQDLWAHSRAIDCKIEASLIEGPVREAVRYGCTEKRGRERMHQLRFYLCPRYNLDGRCDVARDFE